MHQSTSSLIFVRLQIHRQDEIPKLSRKHKFCVRRLLQQSQFLNFHSIFQICECLYYIVMSVYFIHFCQQLSGIYRRENIDFYAFSVWSFLNIFFLQQFKNTENSRNILKIYALSNRNIKYYILIIFCSAICILYEWNFYGFTFKDFLV